MELPAMFVAIKPDVYNQTSQLEIRYFWRDVGPSPAMFLATKPGVFQRPFTAISVAIKSGVLSQNKMFR